LDGPALQIVTELGCTCQVASRLSALVKLPANVSWRASAQLLVALGDDLPSVSCA